MISDSLFSWIFFKAYPLSYCLDGCNNETDDETHRFSSRSQSRLWSQRRTTTRSIHRSGNISHVCQSRIRPPSAVSGSSSSRSYVSDENLSNWTSATACAAYLVVVHDVCLPLVVVALVQAFLLDELADVDVPEGEWRLLGEQLGVGGLACPRRAREQDDGELSLRSVGVGHVQPSLCAEADR